MGTCGVAMPDIFPYPFPLPKKKKNLIGPDDRGPCLTWWSRKPPCGRVECLFWGGFVLPNPRKLSRQTSRKHQPCPCGMSLSMSSLLHSILFIPVLTNTPCASPPPPFALHFKEKNLSLMCECEWERTCKSNHGGSSTCIACDPSTASPLPSLYFPTSLPFQTLHILNTLFLNPLKPPDTMSTSSTATTKTSRSW